MFPGGDDDLVLVNRKLDVDDSDGGELIRLMQADPVLADVPIMLVSNYPEHQANAVALGAEPGFGKLELGKSDVVARLAAFLQSHESDSRRHRQTATSIPSAISSTNRSPQFLDWRHSPCRLLNIH